MSELKKEGRDKVREESRKTRKLKKIGNLFFSRKKVKKRGMVNRWTVERETGRERLH